MLRQFNSNTKKLNKTIHTKVNSTHLTNADLTGSLLNISIPVKTNFNSSTKKLNNIPVVNTKAVVSLDLTGSLLNIEQPNTNKFNSTTKSNPNTTKLVNNKNKIEEFHTEILQYSGMQIKLKVDAFDNIENTLTIKNIKTNYGTEVVSPDNFEILVFGLHIPGNYTIKDVGNDVVIKLNDRYIDYDNTMLDDIYVIGKFVNISMITENNLIIMTENGLEIIL